jgi:uncharacterized protein (TIGR02118 family)
MIKLVYCLKRRPEVSEDEFHRYWLEDHGALVMRLASTMGMKKYVQAHTLAVPLNEILQQSRELREGYDGVAELWWESEDAIIDALSTPEGMEANAALMEDEAKFIDLANSCMWITEEHVIYEAE